jgi:CheY-like chemotaxis protein
VERLDSVLRSFRGTPQEVSGELLTVAASAGVAEHNRDGVGFEALYRAADGALRVAKASGRARVLPAGSRMPRATGEVDTAVAEDGEVLAELLKHALIGAGHRCVVLPGGLPTVHPTPGPARPAVVLLDVDLPGRGGSEVLPALRHTGVGASTPLIVVTACSTDGSAPGS